MSTKRRSFRESRTGFKSLVALVAVLGGAALAADGGDAGMKRHDGGRWHGGVQWVEIDDARLKIEANDTDGDAGVQVFIDSEPWRWIEIYDPRGRRAFRSTVFGRLGKQGGTELFLESAEPTFDELSFEAFLKRFPEGRYRFRGKGLEGERLFGSAMLTHDVPDGPQLISPLEGGPPVDPDDATVRWEPVAAPNGSPIIAYQVLVVLPDTGLEALPKIALDVMMPPTATELAVPPGFLRRGTEYEWEVLAIEESGNQTLSSSFFQTTP